MASGGKGGSRARQAVKNARRRRRHGTKPWMAGKPMMKQGNGGTDKSGTVKPSRVYRSQANAEISRGHPHHWQGLPFRPK
jgi:hypothetical protein